MSIYKGIEKNRSRGAVSRNAIKKDLVSDILIVEPNKKGLFLVKETQNGNYFVYDESFVGYINKKNQCLREIEDFIKNEVEFVNSWDSEWFYILKHEISFNTDIIVSLDTDENPCITGIIHLLEDIFKNYEYQGRSFDIVSKVCREAHKKGCYNYNDIIACYPSIVGLDLYLYEVPSTLKDRIQDYFYIKQ